MTLDALMEERRTLIEGVLDRLLPRPSGPADTLVRAMRYAAMGGGKRLRPFLVLACCEVCGGGIEEALGPAAAVEMIHTYSLIHDDLPAMDDDDLRRGRATVHRAFGEAQAILTGDGLLTLAFEVLASEPPGEALASRRAAAVAAAARGAGVRGMVGGQVADLEGAGGSADADRLEWIHEHKTGALLAACAQIGAIHAGAPPREREILSRYAFHVGHAFQIADDILDRTSTRESLGKTPGKDDAAGKATYPALFGLEGSRSRAAGRVAAAVDVLASLGRPASVLEDLARYAIARSR